MSSDAGIRVLHVDDHPGYLKVAAKFLQRANDGLVVDGATRAEAGLDRLAESDFDCVVSDYDMPGMDGIDFLKSVREQYPNLPFILFTGKGSEQIASEAVSVGVTDYMQKEGGRDQYTVLANRIGNAVEQYRAQREADRTRRRLEELSESSPDCLWMFDRDFEDLLFISNYESVWGRPEANIRNDPRDFLEAVHPDDLPEVEEEMTRLMEGESIDFEVRIERDDSEPGWLWAKGDPVFDDAGDVVRVVGFTRDVTDRKARERRHEAIIQNTDVPIFIKDRDGVYRLVNEAFADYVEMDKAAMEGAHVTDLMDEESAESSLETDRQVMASGEPVTEEVVRSFGGESDVFLSNKVPFRNARGDIIGVMGVSREITDRKEHERELERYATIVETIPEAAFIIDDEGVIADMHGPVDTVTGLESGELRGQPFEDLVEAGIFNERAIEKWLNGVSQLLGDGDEEYVTYEVETSPREGETRQLEVRLALLPSDDSFEGTVGVAREVTERNRREEQLREERDRREVLFENPRDAIVEIEFEGETPVLQDANERFRDVFGYDDAIGRPVAELLVPEEDETQQRHEDIAQRVLSGETVDTEVRRQTRDGPREFRLRVFPVEIHEGYRGSYAIYTDITERKERERELERYETMANTAGDLVYLLDPEGRFLFVNDAVQRLTGYESDELIGKHVRLFMDQEDIARGRELVQELLETEADTASDSYEWELRTADGDTVPCESHITLLQSEGEFAGSVGVVRDISERKKREEQLKNFNRVVSHDLRNPLNVAGGRLELAREECDSDHLEDVAGALDRMDVLIDDLLTLARRGEEIEEPEPVDLSALVTSCWRNVATAKSNLTVSVDRPIVASESRLQQLLENLVSNAVRHGGDDVTVTVGETPDGFYVEDDGPGIPEEQIDELFEVGFSTETDGTGLGLSIVERVAEAHGWTIDVTTGSDGGARFEFGDVTFDT